MRFKILFILFNIVATVSFAQNFAVKGKVIAADTKKPVPNASVYLSNTSIGTTTNETGEFILKYSMNGKFDLIVSGLGYETHVQNIQSDNLTEPLLIILKQKINDLGNVEVRAFDKNGWRKWGSLFIENFIGTSTYANNCTIKNPEVIKFHFSEKRNELTAYSDEQLIIENKSLGYTIHYKLEEFKYNDDAKFLVYTGYPLFEEMKSAKSSVVNRWKKNREEAYHGSMMHFMRSLFKDELEKEGFEVYALKKVTDAERDRIKQLFANAGAENRNMVAAADSAAYYKTVLNYEAATEIILPGLKSRQEIFANIDSTVGVLSIPDHLEVEYLRKGAPNDYLKYLSPKSRKDIQVSKLSFIGTNYVKVYANGSYFDPQHLFAENFWAWWEKMATTLPFDYISD